MDNSAQDGSQQCIKSIIKHWAEARIDGPMQALARYDDAAKQLITIGSVLQGGLVAVYAVLSKQQGLTMDNWQKTGVACFELLFIAFLACAAWVCSLQPEMEAERVTNLLIKAIESPPNNDYLKKEIFYWCGKIEDIVEKKRIGMLAAKILFIVCSVTISGLLLSPLLPGWKYSMFLYIPALICFLAYFKQFMRKKASHLAARKQFQSFAEDKQ